MIRNARFRSLPLAGLLLAAMLLAALAPGGILRADPVPAQLAAPPAHEIAGRSLPAILVVMSEDANGRSLGFGTGFAIAKGIVVTNSHVIEGAMTITLKRVNEERYYTVDRVLEDDPVVDLAVLQSLDLDSPPLGLGASEGLRVGQTVYTLGNPEGLEGTFAIGNISALRQERGLRQVQVTAPISQGSSGGPVLNELGKVVAVVSSQFEMGQNLNFAVPVAYLHDLLRERGIRIDPEDMTAEVEERRPIDQTQPFGGDELGGWAIKGVPVIVGDTRVRDYYWLWCPGYKNIPRGQRVWFNSRSEAEEQGYVLAYDCPDLREEVVDGLSRNEDQAD